MVKDIPQYEVGQYVTIRGLEHTRGFISGILLDTDGIQYRVVYWADSVRRVEWVYPCEIAS